MSLAHAIALEVAYQQYVRRIRIMARGPWVRMLLRDPAQRHLVQALMDDLALGARLSVELVLL